jgi:hypothetical protein
MRTSSNPSGLITAELSRSAKATDLRQDQRLLPGRLPGRDDRAADGYRTLEENQKVEYTVQQGPKGPQAAQVRGV